MKFHMVTKLTLQITVIQLSNTVVIQVPYRDNLSNITIVKCICILFQLEVNSKWCTVEYSGMDAVCLC